MVSRLSRTAPLLSALLSCAAALRLRSTSVTSSRSRHVNPPPLSLSKSKRGQTHPLIPLGLSVTAWTVERGKSEESTPSQAPHHWQEKASESLDAYFWCALRFFQGPEQGAQREKQTGRVQFRACSTPGISESTC